MHLSVVVGTPNEYLAFGSGAGTARVTISRSVDGRDWQVAGNGLSEGIVRGASDDPLGYVAWGSNGPTALTWVSSDGAHFQVLARAFGWPWFPDGTNAVVQIVAHTVFFGTVLGLGLIRLRAIPAQD